VRSHLLWLALLAACGRVGFDDAAGDAAQEGDAPGACVHLFCDDLEDPAFGAWGGVQLDGSATVERDAGFGRTGGSLHAVSPVGSAIAYRYVDAFPAVQAGDQWVRFMLYVATGTPLDMEPVSFMDPTRAAEIVFGLFDTDVDVHSHGFATDFNITQPIAAARDRWVCYELHVRFATVGLVELYRDGVLVVASGAPTAPPAGIVLSRLGIGVASKPTTFSAAVWVDDVAADTARIGCR